MSQTKPYFIDSDNLIYWNIDDARDGSAVTDATVTYILRDSAETSIANGSMSYVSGRTRYEATIGASDPSPAVSVGDTVYVDMTASGSAAGKRRLTRVVQYHGETP